MSKVKPAFNPQPQTRELGAGEKIPRHFTLATRVTTTEFEHVPVVESDGLSIGQLIDQRIDAMRNFWANQPPQSNAKLESIEVSNLEEFM